MLFTWGTRPRPFELARCVSLVLKKRHKKGGPVRIRPYQNRIVIFIFVRHWNRNSILFLFFQDHFLHHRLRFFHWKTRCPCRSCHHSNRNNSYSCRRKNFRRSNSRHSNRNHRHRLFDLGSCHRNNSSRNLGPEHSTDEWNRLTRFARQEEQERKPRNLRTDA
jgi:hypothetical protein